ncbi:hypothetical protein KUCAC02_006155 [Chaenocephalus aceratus]|uniref:Uncharacterized protein n=1 Tax=Chaenocephalus aceratus TaxID=36190 RepID=A0ACB9WSH0_CHAAC|nr:hypothetical protein KUCAC02_006155 [Chaenocephalus aceratus]
MLQLHTKLQEGPKYVQQWTDVVTRVQTVKVESCPGTWLISCLLSQDSTTQELWRDVWGSFRCEEQPELLVDRCGDEGADSEGGVLSWNMADLLPALSGLHDTGALQQDLRMDM